MRLSGNGLGVLGTGLRDDQAGQDEKDETMEDGAHRDSPGLGLAALSHDQTGKEKRRLDGAGSGAAGARKSPGGKAGFRGWSEWSGETRLLVEDRQVAHSTAVGAGGKGGIGLERGRDVCACAAGRASSRACPARRGGRPASHRRRPGGIVRLGMSISIRSPSRTRPIAPPVRLPG